MGRKRGWFRRPPSDEEMREELEAHVAMRAEHDRVDQASARGAWATCSTRARRCAASGSPSGGTRCDRTRTTRGARGGDGLVSRSAPFSCSLWASAPRPHSLPRSTAYSSGRCRSRIRIDSCRWPAVRASEQRIRGPDRIGARPGLRAHMEHDAGAVRVGDGDEHFHVRDI